MTHVITEPVHDLDAEHRKRCRAREDFEHYEGGQTPHLIAEHFEDVLIEVEPVDYGICAPPPCETADCVTADSRGRWRLVLRGCGEEHKSWTYCTPHVGPAFLDAVAQIETGRMWEHV